MAFYDQPITKDEIKASTDERYGKWAMPQFTTGPLNIWRVEPEKFVIQLFTNEEGKSQLIYLIFGAKHPTLQAK